MNMQTAQAKVKEHPTMAFIVTQFILLGIGYLIYTINRMSFPVGLKDISSTFGFTALQTSTLGTVFLLGQGIIDIPAGYMADRFSRRTLFFASMLGIGVVTLAFTVLTFNFASALTWRVAFGMVEGIFNIVLFGLVGSWFPQKRGLLNNLMALFYALGSLIGPIWFGYMLQGTGNWRLPLQIYAATALVWAFVLLFAFRVSERDFPTLAEQKKKIPHGEGFGSAFLKLVKDSSFWRALSIIILNMFPNWGFGGVGAYMLITEKHIDKVLAGTIIGTAFGAGVLMSPLFGYWSDRVGRKAVIATLGVLAAIGFYFLFYSNITTPWLLLVFGFLAGCGVNTIYFMGYTVAQDAVSSEYTGLATGFAGGLGYFLGAFSGFLIGAITETLGYRAAVAIALILPEILVILCALFLIRNKPKEIDAGNSVAA